MRHLPLFTVLLSYLWLLATAVLGGWAYPDYSHVGQYISEPGAQDAPHGRLVSMFGLIPSGLLLIAGCVLLAMRSPWRTPAVWLGLMGLAWYGMGLVVGGALPCDAMCRPDDPSWSQSVHDLVAGGGYLALAASAFVLGSLLARRNNARGLVMLAFTAGTVTVLLLPALHPDSPWAGLAQRLIEICNAAWVLPVTARLAVEQTRRTLLRASGSSIEWSSCPAKARAHREAHGILSPFKSSLEYGEASDGSPWPAGKRSHGNQP